MNKWRVEIRSIAVAIAIACAASFCDADDELQNAKSDSDKQLLEDLQNDLLEGIELDPQSVDQKKDGQPSQSDLPKNDGTTTAPRANASADEHPLTPVGRKMLEVEGRLAKRDSSKATQEMQKKVIEELQKLIKNARRRRGTGSASSGVGGKTAPRAELGKKPGDKSGSASPAGANIESTERLGKAAAKKVDPKDVQKRVEASWGVLPEQVRERMRHSAGEDFLGEYERMIENYFKRLAEGDSNSP